MIVRLPLEDSFQGKWNRLSAKQRASTTGYTNFIWAEDKNGNFLIDFKLTLLQIFPPGGIVPAAILKLVAPDGKFQLLVGVITPAATSRPYAGVPPLLGKTNVSTTLIASFRAFSAAQETV